MFSPSGSKRNFRQIKFCRTEIGFRYSAEVVAGGNFVSRFPSFFGNHRFSSNEDSRVRDNRPINHASRRSRFVATAASPYADAFPRRKEQREGEKCGWPGRIWANYICSGRMRARTARGSIGGGAKISREIHSRIMSATELRILLCPCREGARLYYRAIQKFVKCCKLLFNICYVSQTFESPCNAC